MRMCNRDGAAFVARPFYETLPLLLQCIGIERVIQENIARCGINSKFLRRGQRKTVGGSHAVDEI